MSIFIVLAIAIAAYFLFILAVPKAVPEDKGKVLKAAMEQLYEENRGVEDVSSDILRDQIRNEAPIIRNIFKLSFMQPLYEVGIQAGFQQDIKRLLLITLMLIVGILFVAILMGHFLLGLIFCAPLGYFLMYRHCKSKIVKRNNEFINKFPDALDMIVRSVRSGFPLSTALQMLADNAEEPVKTEFRHVVDDLALGRSLADALSRLAIRINEPDIRFFVVVLSVQQETGGNLSEIVSNLSNVIRKRKQLRLKIKAMTSEGKATGLILGALPFVVFALLSFLQPDYLESFYTTSTGNMFLAVVIGLLVTCFFVVKQMIKIDI